MFVLLTRDEREAEFVWRREQRRRRARAADCALRAAGGEAIPVLAVGLETARLDVHGVRPLRVASKVPRRTTRRMRSSVATSQCTSMLTSCGMPLPGTRGEGARRVHSTTESGVGNPDATPSVKGSAANRMPERRQRAPDELRSRGTTRRANQTGGAQQELSAIAHAITRAARGRRRGVRAAMAVGWRYHQTIPLALVTHRRDAGLTYGTPTLSRPRQELFNASHSTPSPCRRGRAGPASARPGRSRPGCRRGRAEGRLRLAQEKYREPFPGCEGRSGQCLADRGAVRSVHGRHDRLCGCGRRLSHPRSR